MTPPKSLTTRLLGGPTPTEADIPKWLRPRPPSRRMRRRAEHREGVFTARARARRYWLKHPPKVDNPAEVTVSPSLSWLNPAGYVKAVHRGRVRKGGAR